MPDTLPKPPRMLVVEEDRQIRCLLRSALAGEGFHVWEAETLQRGIIDAGTRRPDLVIVDPALRDGDSLKLIREVRSFSCVPILILSARVDEMDKIAALDAGADDYLTKPFGVGELLARTRALLRRNARGGERGSTMYEFDTVRVDLTDRRVTRGAAPVHLTSLAFRLLAYLITREGRLLTHRELLREVWGPTHVDDSTACAFTLRSCVRSWKTSLHILDTSLPRLAWAIGLWDQTAELRGMSRRRVYRYEWS